jgi:hypothetical protein
MRRWVDGDYAWLTWEIMSVAERHARGNRCEIGLHGIDAWLDSSRGREEAKRVTKFSGKETAGVRMHWLYWSEDSPVILEDGGFPYDSTVGYNDAIGYRAGTSQVYKPLQATRILELPLHVMDTALFYPNRLELSPREARKRVSSILDNAVRLGGAVTINWHDRSLAPERQWGRCYQDLLNEVEASAPWFATAGEAVDWFRWRRAIRFRVGKDPRHVHVEAPMPNPHLPAACLIVHRPDARETDAVETRFSGESQTLSPYTATNGPVS